MITVLMQSDKTLVISEQGKIYQREKLIDKIRFLVPAIYDVNGVGMDLTNFTATLEYVDQANVVQTETLTKSEDLYKEKFIEYVLPVDTNVSKYAGEIELRLSLVHYDADTGYNYVLHTGHTKISVSPLSDWYKFVSDESLDVIDQKMSELDSKISALDEMAGTYAANQVDDLKLTNSLLQVSSKGTPMGNGVTIITSGDTEDSDANPSDGELDVNSIVEI